MKNYLSLIAAPVLLLTSACSTHYAVSGHSHGYHREHVSVGVHGHAHGSNVLGALVVGGIIGHALTEASHEREATQAREKTNRDVDEVVNGYPARTDKVQPEVSPEQARFYQLGEDGNCYLMEKRGKESVVISSVPPFSCR